jgi:mannose-1-phosphate guanylyltransferase
VTAFVHRGYWIDIGTPEKYLQVHRDVLDGRFPVQLAGESDRGGWRDPSAYVDPGARLEPPFYIGPGCRVAAGATVGPRATLTRTVTVDAGARVSDSVAWTGSHIGENATVEGALLAEHVHCAASSVVRPGAVLGKGAVLPPFSRTGA